MLSNILDRISFWSLFLVVVLLPIFFLPFTKIPIDVSKSLLLVVGLSISIIFWLIARFSDGKIILPRSWLLASGFGIALVFLISALFSPALKVSFFGLMLDTGTFWFMLSAVLLMFMSSVLLRDIKNAKIILKGLVVSSAILIIFQSLFLFIPHTLSLGILGNKTDNILGSFNALGLFAGFSAFVCLFVFEFFQNKKIIKWFLAILLVLSIFLAIVVNFSIVWGILGVFSLLIFVFKISFSLSKGKTEGKKNFPVASFVVIMVSILFFMSGNFVGSFLPNRLQISSNEISPSFSATMSVAKSVFIKDPILGAGPNRFVNSWAMYKPTVINTTLFWNNSFDSGSGVLPTFAITTGSLGILSWIIFIALLLFSGFKFIFNLKNKEDREIQSIFFFSALFLFISVFFYSTGAVLFILSFAFIGAFIGIATLNHPKGNIIVSFLDDPRKSFFSILLLVIMMVISVSLLFKFTERFVSILYFQKTFTSQTIPEAESNIMKAISLYSNDLYLRTFSQTYIAKINTLAAKGQSITESEKADLQSSLDKAISSAQLAIDYDQTNYLNFNSLGAVYETVAPLGVTGAYDKAISAYKSSSDLSPLNPELKLLLARVSFAKDDIKGAKDYANEALSIKSNYVDALVFLSQIAKNEGNNDEALSYAEAAFLLSPKNTTLEQYIDYLKNPSSEVVNPVKDNTKNEKPQ